MGKDGMGRGGLLIRLKNILEVGEIFIKNTKCGNIWKFNKS